MGKYIIGELILGLLSIGTSLITFPRVTAFLFHLPINDYRFTMYMLGTFFAELFALLTLTAIAWYAIGYPRKRKATKK